MNPARCWDCRLPNDQKVTDNADAKSVCASCGKHGYARYNATGKLYA